MHTPRSISSNCYESKTDMVGTDTSNIKKLHIALMCPFSSGPGRGNITTVCRIANTLPAAGCRITQVNLDEVSEGSYSAALDRDRPDLLHAFHAYHAGPAARRVFRRSGIPYLITITGSDLFDANLCSAPETRNAIADAAALTCFDALVAQRLAEDFPQIADLIAVIPQGVAPLPLKNPYPRSVDDFLILLPAGLRPVKGVTDAIAALTPLALEFPALRLLVAGGAIDSTYAAAVNEISARLTWVNLLGDVPHHEMGALYTAADLVLNASLFEGGMANSLLEGMSMGKPVLARNVVGNRSLIRHGETGWLYRDDDELRQLVRLLFDRKHRVEIGAAGRDFVQMHCSPQSEANRYAALYQQIVR